MFLYRYTYGERKQAVAPERTGPLESPDSGRLLKPADVRESFGIAASTVRLWDHMGILKPTQRTKGGHRRYRESDVRSLLAELEAVA